MLDAHDTKMSTLADAVAKIVGSAEWPPGGDGPNQKGMKGGRGFQDAGAAIPYEWDGLTGRCERTEGQLQRG
ncbi:hypothetical protein Hypma_004118 [Hypsizygus marmoreus]|uniref:Uncharacterized protein n=1 Tax=Hypsizygus marmoreus TaxID=39966 RepID=A0A369JYL5_HYPMA|nr:hypothetical protein Hypma_004118 [Hypsizygus marmoreus]